MIRILFAVLVCLITASPVAMADDEKPQRPERGQPAEDPVHKTGVFIGKILKLRAEAVSRASDPVAAADIRNLPMVLPGSKRGGTIDLGIVKIPLVNETTLYHDVSALSFAQLFDWTSRIYMHYVGQREPQVMGARAAATVWGAVHKWAVEQSSNPVTGTKAEAEFWWGVRHTSRMMERVALFAHRNGQSVIHLARQGLSESKDWILFIGQELGW